MLPENPWICRYPTSPFVHTIEVAIVAVAIPKPSFICHCTGVDVFVESCKLFLVVIRQRVSCEINNRDIKKQQFKGKWMYCILWKFDRVMVLKEMVWFTNRTCALSSGELNPNDAIFGQDKIGVQGLLIYSCAIDIWCEVLNFLSCIYCFFIYLLFAICAWTDSTVS